MISIAFSSPKMDHDEIRISAVNNRQLLRKLNYCKYISMSDFRKVAKAKYTYHNPVIEDTYSRENDIYDRNYYNAIRDDDLISFIRVVNKTSWNVRLLKLYELDFLE